MSSSLRFVLDKRLPAPPPPQPPLLPPLDPGSQYAMLTSYVAPPNYPILPGLQGFYGPYPPPYICLGAALPTLNLPEQVPHTNEGASPSSPPKPQPEPQAPSCFDQCETGESHPQSVPIGTSLNNFADFLVHFNNSTIKAIETRLQKFERALEVTAQRILDDQRRIEERILGKTEITLRNFQNTVVESTKHLSAEGRLGMNFGVSNAVKDTMLELGHHPEGTQQQTAANGTFMNTLRTCIGTEKGQYTAVMTDAGGEVGAEERDVALMIDRVHHGLEPARKIPTSATIQAERSTSTSSAGHVNGLSIGDAQDAIQRRGNVLSQHACLVSCASLPCHPPSVPASRSTSVTLKRKLDAAGIRKGRHTEYGPAKSFDLDLHTINNSSNIGEPISPVFPGRSVFNLDKSQPPVTSEFEDGLDSCGENDHNGDDPDATTSSSAILPANLSSTPGKGSSAISDDCDPPLRPVVIVPMAPTVPVERQYKCPHGCGRSYTHRRDLRHHVNDGVGACVMPKLRYWCLNDCGRSYADRKAMRRHLKKCLEAGNNGASDSVKRMKAEEKDETSGEGGRREKLGLREMPAE